MGRRKLLGRLQRLRTKEGDDDAFGGSLPSGGGGGGVGGGGAGEGQNVARPQPV